MLFSACWTFGCLSWPVAWRVEKALELPPAGLEQAEGASAARHVGVTVVAAARRSWHSVGAPGRGG